MIVLYMILESSAELRQRLKITTFGKTLRKKKNSNPNERVTRQNCFIYYGSQVKGQIPLVLLVDGGYGELMTLILMSLKMENLK